ncbi:MAG: hypothetical protein AYK19_02965 [Theionarchaea archaeon DG-70-1]|nr:MAG: hypothetical protein AYK19_02965 [Theionarchaea archaeon DG-70-1]
MDTEAWWNQVGVYNKAVFPMQIVMLAAAVILTYFLTVNPSTKMNKLMKGFLSLVCVWNAVVFFLIFGRELPGTILGAPLFVLAAVLFAWDMKEGKTQFRSPETKWQKYVTALLIVCAFAYPVIGYGLGHVYPKACTFGTMPCPTTVFALALLAAAVPKVDKKVYIVLLVWALPAFGKCLGALNLYEDCILFWAGIYALAVLVKKWKIIEGGVK